MSIMVGYGIFCTIVIGFFVLVFMPSNNVLTAWAQEERRNGKWNGNSTKEENSKDNSLLLQTDPAKNIEETKEGKPGFLERYPSRNTRSFLRCCNVHATLRCCVNGVTMLKRRCVPVGM